MKIFFDYTQYSTYLDSVNRMYCIVYANQRTLSVCFDNALSGFVKTKNFLQTFLKIKKNLKNTNVTKLSENIQTKSCSKKKSIFHTKNANLTFDKTKMFLNVSFWTNVLTLVEIYSLDLFKYLL